MKQFKLLLVIAVIMLACNNQKTSTTPIQSDTIMQQQTFFPILDFIGGQIKMIDSLQLPLTKSVTSNNKTKLEALSDTEFKLLARNFQQPDINDTAIRKFYKETSIADQSIPSVTLIYSTSDTMLPIQKASVFIKPDPFKNDKVSAIYIEKLFKQNDTLINQKLYWKTDKNFQVITEKKIGNRLLPVEQVKVIWDPFE
jgi:hypothetical protein